jgi:hypothetical protein
MKIELFLDKILLYYDEPQIFSAKDKILTNYLVMLVDYENDAPMYVALPVSEKKLALAMEGKLDIRLAFSESELDCWYIVKDFEDIKAWAQSANFDTIPEVYLPEAGLFLQNEQTPLVQENSEVLRTTFLKL